MTRTLISCACCAGARRLWQRRYGFTASGDHTVRHSDRYGDGRNHHSANGHADADAYPVAHLHRDADAHHHADTGDARARSHGGHAGCSRFCAGVRHAGGGSAARRMGAAGVKSSQPGLRYRATKDNPITRLPDFHCTTTRLKRQTPASLKGLLLLWPSIQIHIG